MDPFSPKIQKLQGNNMTWMTDRRPCFSGGGSVSMRRQKE